MSYPEDRVTWFTCINNTYIGPFNSSLIFADPELNATFFDGSVTGRPSELGDFQFQLSTNDGPFTVFVHVDYGDCVDTVTWNINQENTYVVDGEDVSIQSSDPSLNISLSGNVVTGIPSMSGSFEFALNVDGGTLTVRVRVPFERATIWCLDEENVYDVGTLAFAVEDADPSLNIVREGETIVGTPTQLGQFVVRISTVVAINLTISVIRCGETKKYVRFSCDRVASELNGKKFLWKLC